MMSSPRFADECQELFTTTNLYAVLGLPTGNTEKLTEKEIKRAYYKCSLKFHPDRVQNSSASSDHTKLATRRFQLLSKAYSILSDAEKKKIYDQTGTVDEEGIDDDFNWREYWRTLFQKVTVKDIENFKRTYKGSQEETDDLKEVYLKHEGHFEHICESAICADSEDDRERIRSLLQQMVDDGVVEHFEQFGRKETERQKKARLRRAEKEAKEAEEMLKNLTGKQKQSYEELVGAITQRNANRGESLIAGLEEKYGGTSGGGSGRKRSVNVDGAEKAAKKNNRK